MANDCPEREEANEICKWEGLSELDKAIRYNRLMEYRIRKSWAEPWGYRLTIAALVLIAAGFSYLAGMSLLQR